MNRNTKTCPVSVSGQSSLDQPRDLYALHELQPHSSLESALLRFLLLYPGSVSVPMKGESDSESKSELLFN